MKLKSAIGALNDAIKTHKEFLRWMESNKYLADPDLKEYKQRGIKQCKAKLLEFELAIKILNK